jgi:hypothetical protein
LESIEKTLKCKRREERVRALEEKRRNQKRKRERARYERRRITPIEPNSVDSAQATRRTTIILGDF